MKNRFHLLCFIIIVIEPVNTVLVDGFVGETAILPCNDTVSDQTEVFWRYKGKTRVFRIAAGGGVASGDSQDMQFANRITYFPEEYSKGNFSILLSNLTRNDSGKYTCFVVPSNVVKDVDLNVTGLGVVNHMAWL
ncbi:CD276 antigen homolog isoform X1 [Denticeps clupeoides]|uniref:CD276 antigen homolog isoform X1 n=1 Tax=Denticeps clupeoides TaxID=299321 RepID=UPI0010A4498B|nr:CD276 antigen homolog isoform X1 [Denticeps clupeoides]